MRNSSRMRTFNIVAVVIIIAICTFIGVSFYLDNKQQSEYSQWAEKQNQEEAESRKAAKEELEKKKEGKTFYQKLAEGFEVNVLIIGDAFGAGYGASGDEDTWEYLFNNYLHNTYGSNIYTNNISLAGNTSYSGYVQTNALSDGKKYDLAIICCGENDDEKELSVHYESLIRSIQSKYSECFIVSILESSQRKYTDKVKTIQSLAEHYGIPVADTIKPFQNNYDNLVTKEKYPNDDGQKLYFEALKNIVDSNVKAKIAYKKTEITPMNKDVSKYDEFTWYDMNKFTRVDATTGTITIKEKGILGIDCSIEGNKSKIEIYVDDKLFASNVGPEDPDVFTRRIMKVSEKLDVKKEIKIVFADRSQADTFKGICVSK